MAAVALAIGIAVAITQIGRDHSRSSSAGLPQTSDYHSLLVSPASANELTLGTHQGLFHSGDGGKTWRPAGLASADAMNLDRTTVGTVWAAGHYLFAKSVDGGRSWENVSPPGLPSLDIHGFAVDPRNPARLYAAVAGEGLYRSSDGGRSFAPRSREVGGAVMALTVTPDGRILAGDMERGLLASSDGGRRWRPLVRAQIFGLALDPVEPKRILAAGPGVLLSTDAGASWRQVLQLDQGAGPVAWTRGAAGCLSLPRRQPIRPPIRVGGRRPSSFFGRCR